MVILTIHKLSLEKKKTSTEHIMLSISSFSQFTNSTSLSKITR
jgi:hypothetical protein